MNLTITNIIETIAVNKNKLGITLYAPASHTDIIKFENVMGVKLPDDVATFYAFSNGFESEEDMFRIIPLDEIIDNRKDRNTYTVEPMDFHIAEYMIYCDMWTINISSDNNNDYKIYNKTEKVITLTTSFADFLNIFLNGGVYNGLYAWSERLSK